MAPRKKKEEAIEVTPEIEMKCLTEAEMRQMESMNAKIREAEAVAKLAVKDIEAAKLRAEIMRLKISEMERDLKSKRDVIVGAQTGYKSFTDMLKKQYELSESWGYDPLTGEIKE